MGVISILIILASVLLILIVLIQNSKGGGLDSNIASQSQAFGAQKTTELVEKLTWGLAAALIVFSVLSTKIISEDGLEEAPEKIENTQETDQE